MYKLDNNFNKVIRFYQSLPNELINDILNYIHISNREMQRKLAKQKTNSDKVKFLLEPLSTRELFCNAAYNTIKDSIPFDLKQTSYEDIISGINDNNKITYTIFFFRWCYEDDENGLSNDHKYFKSFVNSELFDKILSGKSLDSLMMDKQENEIDKKAVESQDNHDVNLTDNIEDTETIISKEEILSSERMVHNMKLLGRIEKKNSYFNFFPKYEFVNEKYEEINKAKLKQDFPTIGGINLSYTFGGKSDDFLRDEIFADLYTDPFVKSIYLADINDEDIEDNDDYIYLRKIDLEKLNNNGKHLNDVVQKVDRLNIYKVVTNESTMPIDFTSRIILLKESNLIENESVVLFYQNKYYGPFTVSFRAQDDKFYIKTDAKENNYLVPYYFTSSVINLEFEKGTRFEEQHITRYIHIIGESHFEDVITDDILLEEIIDDISLELAKESPEEFARKCRNSAFFADKDFSENRIKRLLEILDKADEFTTQKRNIFDSLFNSFVSEQQVVETEWYKALKSEKDDLSKKQEEKDKKLKELSEENKTLYAKIKDLSNSKPNEAPVEEIEKLQEEIKKLTDEKELLEDKLDEAKELIQTTENIDILKDEQTKLEAVKEYLEEKNKDLKSKEKILKEKAASADAEVLNAIKKGFNDAASVAFEPYIAGKMLEAAAQENTRIEDEKYIEIHNRLERINASKLQGNELIDYIVKYVQSQREYDYNDIVNIYICVALNFITIFSGEPGTGKTSMCNIIAKSLGLLNYGDDDINRYVSISVEKGWSSKRDLIGYYNPLTRRYDKNNSKFYDALRILDLEQDKSPYPFLVMLDEANLSPMEYYWADFMRLTDRSSINDTKINIGLEKDIFIPETLHYLATINTDQTTEKLSPRLIDRACIIRLPKVKVKDKPEENISQFEIITWDNYIDAFTSQDDVQYNQNTNKILEKIYILFERYGMNISPRIQEIIKKYVISAEKIMVENNGANKTQVAIDYAIVQKLLPKINGHYAFLKGFFDNLKTLCKEYHLNLTNAAIDQIEEAQERNMGYCQYLI